MKRRRFVEPAADFPSDLEIERAAPTAMAEAERWLALIDQQTAALLALIDQQTAAIERDLDAQIAATPGILDASPPVLARYVGGARHIPPEYVGALCVVVGASRRKSSRRVRFPDGLMTSIKAKLLEPITCR